MTVKERLRKLVEAMPDELPETAAAAVEGALRPYRKAPPNGPRPVTKEERRARRDATRQRLEQLRDEGLLILPKQEEGPSPYANLEATGELASEIVLRERR